MYSETDVDTAAREWVETADDDVLACRGAVRHGFDKLHRNRPMPNTHTEPVEGSRHGVYVVVQTCPDCGLVEREMVTGPHAEIDLPARWRYRVDKRYKAPKGSRVTPRMCLAEEVRRMNEDGWARKAVQINAG